MAEPLDAAVGFDLEILLYLRWIWIVDGSRILGIFNAQYDSISWVLNRICTKTKGSDSSSQDSIKNSSEQWMFPLLLSYLTGVQIFVATLKTLLSLKEIKVFIIVEATARINCLIFRTYRVSITLTSRYPSNNSRNICPKFTPNHNQLSVKKSTLEVPLNPQYVLTRL